MLESNIFKEYTPSQRIQLLEDNAEEIEAKGYMRKFSEDEIQEFKEDLSEVSIEINDIETEAKETARGYKDQLKPMIDKKVKMLKNIKEKAEFVTENCYKFVDHVTGEVGYYNGCGELIDQRAITPKERQRRLSFESKTGTNN